VENKTETISFISLILGVVFFILLPIQELWYSVSLFCFGFSLALIKRMWVWAGMFSDRIEEL